MATTESGDAKHKIVSVAFTRVEDMKIKPIGLKDNESVEIRVENSVPTLKIEKVPSPARKVRNLLLSSKH